VIAALAVAAALAGCAPVEKAAQQRRAEYIIMNPNLPPDIRSAIKNKQIIRGMTMSDVEMSWGKPAGIEKVASGEGWTYKRRVYGAKWHSQTRTYRVVFLDGRVASFTEIDRTR
jgi:hypothetical protein